MKKYLEQHIPMKSRISNEQRKAWLSDPRARFRPVEQDRIAYEAVAEFFGERGWDMDRIFVPSVRDGETVFNFSDEAVGEIGRACHADPTLYGRLFPGSLH